MTMAGTLADVLLMHKQEYGICSRGRLTAVLGIEGMAEVGAFGYSQRQLFVPSAIV